MKWFWVKKKKNRLIQKTSLKAKWKLAPGASLLLLLFQPWFESRFLVHLLFSFSPLFPGISSPNKGRSLLSCESSRPKHPGGSPLALTWPCFQAELEFSIREAVGWAFTRFISPPSGSPQGVILSPGVIWKCLHTLLVTVTTGGEAGRGWGGGLLLASIG